MLIRAASEAFERDEQGVADAVEVSWALPFGLYADAPTIDALLHTCALHRSVTWYFPDLILQAMEAEEHIALLAQLSEHNIDPFSATLDQKIQAFRESKSPAFYPV